MYILISGKYIITRTNLYISLDLISQIILQYLFIICNFLVNTIYSCYNHNTLKYFMFYYFFYQETWFRFYLNTLLPIYVLKITFYSIDISWITASVCSGLYFGAPVIKLRGCLGTPCPVRARANKYNLIYTFEFS